MKGTAPRAHCLKLLSVIRGFDILIPLGFGRSNSTGRNTVIIQTGHAQALISIRARTSERARDSVGPRALHVGAQRKTGYGKPRNEIDALKSTR